MRNVIGFIRNASPVIFIILICFCLWALNARNGQFEATNDRLNETVKILRERNVALYDRNDTLAHTMNNLTNRVGELGNLLSVETKRRADAEVRANQLQRENEFLKSQKQCRIAIDPNSAEKGKKDANTVVIQASPAGE